MTWWTFFVSLFICSSAHSKTIQFWKAQKANPAFAEHLQHDSKISFKAIEQALNYLATNQKAKRLSQRFIGVADFSKPSNTKRLAIIDLNTGQMDYYKVAHGKGSDKDHNLILDSFSDKEGSHQTPHGFHKMTTTYHGQHGLSLRMEGLEKHNKTSMKRAIVLHGAKYVSWKHPGRSFGCPSVEKKFTKKIINQLKDGALFYHFKGF